MVFLGVAELFGCFASAKHVQHTDACESTNHSEPGRTVCVAAYGTNRKTMAHDLLRQVPGDLLRDLLYPEFVA